MKACRILALALLISQPALGALPPIRYTVTPIVGFEKAVKTIPDFHTHIRFLYGALVTAGYRQIALESEYTRATDSETFPILGLSMRDTDDRLKLGLRTQHSVLPFVLFTLRAGGQASRNIHEETRLTGTTKTTGKIRYRPYAGTELGLLLVRWFEISAGVTAVFNDFPDMSKTDYQGTLGVALRF